MKTADDIVFETEGGPKSFAYGEFLKKASLDDGVVYLFGGIEDGLANLISMELSYVFRSNNKKAVLEINSQGGGIYSALNILETVRQFEQDGRTITAHVNGMAASAASMIVLQSASKRTSTKSARFLFHEPRRWAYGMETSSGIRDEADEMSKVSDMIYTIMAKRSKKTIEELKKLIERRELWMSAEEALEHNFIDAIIE